MRRGWVGLISSVGLIAAACVPVNAPVQQEPVGGSAATTQAVVVGAGIAAPISVVDQPQTTVAQQGGFNITLAQVGTASAGLLAFGASAAWLLFAYKSRKLEATSDRDERRACNEIVRIAVLGVLEAVRISRLDGVESERTQWAISDRAVAVVGLNDSAI